MELKSVRRINHPPWRWPQDKCLVGSSMTDDITSYSHTVTISTLFTNKPSKSLQLNQTATNEFYFCFKPNFHRHVLLKVIGTLIWTTRPDPTDTWPFQSSPLQIQNFHPFPKKCSIFTQQIQILEDLKQTSVPLFIQHQTVESVLIH